MRRLLQRIKYTPYVTIGLMVINFVVFLLTEIGGSSESTWHMYRWGAMLTSSISEDGEYWRMFTAMFLHFGFEHLASNLLVLFALGTVLEKGIGHLRLALIYLVSGVGANAITFLWHYRMDEEVLSAGASGAIFGLMGAMIFAGLFAREWIGALSLGQVILMLILSLYHGVNEAVSDIAHLSGLFVGFLTAILLLKVFPGQYLYDRRRW
ncbi:MAG: rhomboid family intramembrane serine protease [Lachnospiraceae bacterium]|nr:rhomboid family intramembrane serine protease [Lachnospiraceae bacterium]